jgi:hypothetical protein
MHLSMGYPPHPRCSGQVSTSKHCGHRNSPAAYHIITPSSHPCSVWSSTRPKCRSNLLTTSGLAPRGRSSTDHNRAGDEGPGAREREVSEMWGDQTDDEGIFTQGEEALHDDTNTAMLQAGFLQGFITAGCCMLPSSISWKAGLVHTFMVE